VNVYSLFTCIAAGGATHTRQVVIELLDKARYPDRPGWGLGAGADVLTSVNCLETLPTGRPWPKNGLKCHRRRRRLTLLLLT